MWSRGYDGSLPFVAIMLTHMRNRSRDPSATDYVVWMRSLSVHTLRKCERGVTRMAHIMLDRLNTKHEFSDVCSRKHRNRS